VTSVAANHRRVVFAVVVAIAAGGALAAFGWREAPQQWLYSYLTAWLFWGGITLGSISILLLHNLTGGAWGLVARPALRAAAATLPVVALLFLPIALYAESIYPWASPSGAEDHIVEHKRVYLNLDAFRIRAAVYFTVWLALGLLLAWQSRRTRAPGTPAERRMRRLSGQGLGLHALAVTFASVDWMMSLEPHWFSTIYGVIVFGAQGLAAHAWAILATALALRSAPPETIEPQRTALHDLGKLLLGFLMFWAYVAFSQFLIVWYGNLPEEVVWYLKRFARPWGAVALSLVVLHFAVPFIVLLSREVKRHPARLAAVAGLILVMHWVDTVWQVQPAMTDAASYRLWLDAALLIAIGGVWCAVFLPCFWSMQPAWSASEEVRHG
jgi:hypothetical protein